MTRWQLLAKGKEDPQFPDIDPNEYLAEWLGELGWCLSNGMGVVGIPHTEIRAWADNIGLRFRGVEAAWLHAMSAAYAAEIGRSDDKDVSAPFSG